MFADKFNDLVIVDFTSSKCVDADRSRFGKSNRIRELNFTTLGKTGGDDIFSDVTCSVCRGSVDFTRIFSGESSAAVARHAAVSIHNNFSAC